MEPTLYQLLGVDRSATPEELHSAFKTLAVACHPDKLPAMRGGAAVKARTMDFTAISAAYAELKEPLKRAAYDAELAIGQAECGVCMGKGRRYHQRGFTGRVAEACPDCKGTGFTGPTTKRRRK